MIHSLRISITLLASIIIAGCAAKGLMVPVTRPAEINLNKFKKIAVGDFEGQASQDLREELTNALFNSGRFEVLDRDNLNRILAEHKLSASSMFDEASAAEAGRLLGASAFVTGRTATYGYEKKPSKDQPTKWKDGSYHTWHQIMVTAEVSVNFKVTDMTTGRLLITTTIPVRTEDKTGAWDKWPEPPDGESMLVACRQSVTAYFMKKIAPYTQQVKATILTDKKMPELQTGLMFAKTGNWEKAAASFSKAAETYNANPKLHFAYYDLGIAYMYAGRYQDARTAINKALELSPDKKYMGALNTIDEEEKAAKKLAEQMRGS